MRPASLHGWIKEERTIIFSGMDKESLGIGKESLGIGKESLGIGKESLGMDKERTRHNTYGM